MKLQGFGVVETSAICNKSCGYCPYTKAVKERPIGLMTMDTFKRAIYWIKYFRNKPFFKKNRSVLTNYINLHGIGEPFLNPLIFDMIDYAQKELPEVDFRLATNCSLITEDLIKKISKSGISRLDLTDHVAEDTVRAMMLREKYGIDGEVYRDFVGSSHNWAGQIDWIQYPFSPLCINLQYGIGVVTWNGLITTCCLDGTNKMVVGHIDDDNIFDIEIKPGALCSKCHHHLPLEFRGA